MANVVHVNASALRQAGTSVADALDRAAQPTRVPMATPGTSPADAAAGAVAAAMGVKVAAAASELAPRGPKIRAASEAAAASLTATDERNAALLQGVPATAGEGALGGNPGSGVTGRVQMVGDGWDDPAEPWKIGEGFVQDHYGAFVPPIQINPGGGAAGGGSGGTAPV